MAEIKKSPVYNYVYKRRSHVVPLYLQKPKINRYLRFSSSFFNAELRIRLPLSETDSPYQLRSALHTNQRPGCSQPVTPLSYRPCRICQHPAGQMNRYRNYSSPSKQINAHSAQMELRVLITFKIVKNFTLFVNLKFLNREFAKLYFKTFYH